MAEQKIFAGPRIRRIRNSLELTQMAMAEELGISPSYLNLIERNQRPLTVQLLLKLAATYKLDLNMLRGQSDDALGALKQVFADPLLSAELPSDQELIELAEAAPNAAAGFVRLYKAFRESQDRLSDLKNLLASEGHETGLLSARLPADEVREVFETRPNYFDRIEQKAEAFSEILGIGAELAASLKQWMRTEHNIAIRQLPVQAMPHWRRQFDRHTMRLNLSERLSPFDQLREIAIEACLLYMREAIDTELGDLALSGDEALRMARFELARYAAHALIMPYTVFQETAIRVKYDADVLRSRFACSFEQVVNRLTMLQRKGKTGIPFFMLEIDHAGNRFRRAGAKGYPHAGFGELCPKLPIHAVFTQPGQIVVEQVETPSGENFLVIVRTLEGPQGAFGERVRRTAVLLGCEANYAGETVYGAHAEAAKKPTRIGPACRLCERKGCLSRVEPPITRSVGLDEMVAGLSAYEFQ